jgi:RNA polymerase-binding transcription factor DksA
MSAEKARNTNDAYLEEKRNHLLARRKSKLEILNGGGQSALLHSKDDITRIDFALKRIEKGQYGLCPCGCKIEENRLNSVPETIFCLFCQKEIELKKRRLMH